MQILADRDTFVECVEAELAVPDASLAHRLFDVLEVAGKVNTREVVLGLALRIGKTVEEKLRTLFWLFDRDRSGYIDKVCVRCMCRY